jgi:phosphoribosyl 1,2-cyclic phosphodiesterase
MFVRFWGLRGGSPRGGRDTSRFGANTACLEVRCGRTLIILDGGSGLINLGRELTAGSEGRRLEAHLFLSHTHWDHVLGLPYFQPVYSLPGCLFVYGVAGMDDVLLSFFRGSEAGEFYPAPLGQPSMDISFVELQERTEVDEAVVSYYYLNHPGLTLGFRVEYQDRSLVYLSDNQPYRESPRVFAREEGGQPEARLDPDVVQFARGADLLVADAWYSDEEALPRGGYGHSSVNDALQIALAAQARRLVPFHHPPLRTDEQIEGIVQECRRRVAERQAGPEILAPVEGEVVEL